MHRPTSGQDLSFAPAPLVHLDGLSTGKPWCTAGHAGFRDNWCTPLGGRTGQEWCTGILLAAWCSWQMVRCTGGGAHLVGLRKHAHRANGAKRPVAPGGVAHDLRPGAIGLRCTGARLVRGTFCTGHLCTISSRWTGHLCTRLWRIVEDLVHLIHLCSGGGGAHGPGAPYSLGRWFWCTWIAWCTARWTLAQDEDCAPVVGGCGILHLGRGG